jgi:(R,R)-butanediol dehydrogenase/meso-butanediol dehydrogenase/diacetyl reductase
MRAAVFHDRGDLRVEIVPDPAPQAGELLIEVKAVGICGTDAHEYASGPHMFPIHERHQVTGHVGPMIPGHEFAGVVRDVGVGVTGFAEGNLVASGAGISCGDCTHCRRRRTNLCDHYSTVGLQRNGALAQFVAVPAAICVPVATYGLRPDTAGLAQPMSIAVHAMRRGRLTERDQAIIVGAGGIGSFLTYAAASVADAVTVVDLDRGRLQIADAVGATHTVQSGDADEVGQAVSEFGLVPTVVFEVTGSAPGLRTALKILPRGGRLVLVGLQDGSVPWDIRSLSLIEHELIGTNGHVCDTDMPAALELLASRPTPWSDVAPVAIGLDDLVPEGLQPLIERRSTRIKTLIDPWVHEIRPTDMAVRA